MGWAYNVRSVFSVLPNLSWKSLSAEDIRRGFLEVLANGLFSLLKLLRRFPVPRSWEHPVCRQVHRCLMTLPYIEIPCVCLEEYFHPPGCRPGYLSCICIICISRSVPMSDVTTCTLEGLRMSCSHSSRESQCFLRPMHHCFFPVYISYSYW